MPSQRVVIVLPEQPEPRFLAIAMAVRDFFEAGGYRTAIRYGADGFDDDLTPVDGAHELEPLLVTIGALPG
jgi:hypothetical protein